MERIEKYYEEIRKIIKYLTFLMWTNKVASGMIEKKEWEKI